MSVWYRQAVDGEVLDGPRRIEPHYEGQSDGSLLATKAQGAKSQKWEVEWVDERSFTATKVRWAEEAVCVREFWVAD